MDRIALFLPNWIGDAVMATPAFRAVRQQFPSAHLTAIGRPGVLAAVEGAPWFDAIVASPGKATFRVVKALKRHRPDTAILFPNSLRSALVARFAGCKRRIGFARHGRSWLLTDRLHHVMSDGKFVPMPIIDDYNRLVSHIGATPDRRMELFTTPNDEIAADRVWQRSAFLGKREVIGLNTGGAFGAAKDWPLASFVKLARMFADRRNAGVLVVCGPAERASAQAIVEACERAGVRSLAEESVSLGLTKACVKRLNLLITTDSGPRHFAAAFNRPVITLFGPTHIGWTETFYTRAVHLQEKLPCGPCQQRICPEGHHRCMKDLTPERVFASAEELLRRMPLGGLRHVG